MSDKPNTILESEAGDDAKAAQRLELFNATSLRSIAISMKRLADIASGMTLNGGLEDAAFRAGEAFARGNYQGTRGR